MKKSQITILIALLFIILVFKAYAVPVGPTITEVSNTTKTAANPTMLNSTHNGTAEGKAGGYIFTINLSSDQQDTRWKAYVGNVSGKLVLAGADNYAIYDWTLTSSLTGEIYATRASSTITWGNVNCSNLTQIESENTAMSHTNANDNITATFPTQDNNGFELAGGTIIPNDCYTTNLYVDGAPPGDHSFEEVLLHDGTNMIYTSIIEDDHDAYMNSNEPYDFQMIVPEIGIGSWQSSTAYYFYVELV
ncbi:hypothetical protein COY26_04330 [Candidatus Woesearchaeota archaeon CG_4_10_14_0_2_um_filter_33_10]|nr:MAG: hypothetical protein AUJ83_04105 [Candidatus Woesearchaeota archaeon CG1_02_33_12]PIU72413.1 MAG: hypothetical protein COS79_03055 [Candidatus Woesearchaeota archaeon CG06_land_8_20_14_3_00_33_13]PIZ52571.1 MAG: hypothetical protein COY26_04330 [Candidatus Woesearchaeota archaeon CG_4_10_14_0_2_um_filter_33_10]